MGKRETKLSELGYPSGDVPTTAATYRLVAVDGTTAYCSGALPLSEGQLMYKGKVPSEVPLGEAQKAAALCAANCLRMAYQEFGSLDRIQRILRVTGYVNSDLDFTDQHLVVNGASQLLLDVFGKEHGFAARSAVGLAQLPLGSTVELEMILQLDREQNG